MAWPCGSWGPGGAKGNSREMHSNLRWRLATVVIVFVLAFFISAPSLGLGPYLGYVFGSRYEDMTMTLGLDLQGGVDLIYRVEPEAGDAGRLDEIVRTSVEILRNRLDQFGVGNLSVQRQGKDQVRIQIPGLSAKNLKRVKDIIVTTDLLTFNLVTGEGTNIMELVPRPDEKVLPLVEPPEGSRTNWTPTWFVLKKEPEVIGEDLSYARIGYDEFGKPKILLEFNSKGRSRFGEVTRRLVKQHLAIVLANKVYMAPEIREPILDGNAEITGKFDLEETKRIVGILKAGSLPAKLVVIAENVVGPTLGEESIKAGVIASIIGLLLVIAFMVVRYKKSGLLAILALVNCLLLVVVLLLFFRAALTLPGIAGIILTIGMAVDANVLIFERIKEEFRQGKTLRAGIDAGFDKAWSAIIDSNLTTLFTTIILYMFGTGPIKGFAVTLGIGIIASLYSAIFMVRTLFEWTHAGRKAGTLSI